MKWLKKIGEKSISFHILIGLIEQKYLFQIFIMEHYFFIVKQTDEPDVWVSCQTIFIAWFCQSLKLNCGSYFFPSKLRQLIFRFKAVKIKDTLRLFKVLHVTLSCLYINFNIQWWHSMRWASCPIWVRKWTRPIHHQ